MCKKTVGALVIILGVMYFVGHVLTHLFDTVKVPDVLILIFFGILMGPILGLIDTEHIGYIGVLFTHLALVIILFEGGLNLEFSNVWRSARQAIKLTVSFFFITAIVVTAIMHYGFGYSLVAGLATGVICGGTSSAVVIPMVSAMKVGSEARAILILESALTDVLCIVFTIGVLQSVEYGTIAVGRIVKSLVFSFILSAILGVAGGVVWMNIINLIRRFSNTQFATFAFMFIVYGIAETLDLSGAIASLAFGMVLGNNLLVARSLSQVKQFRLTTPDIIVTDAEKKLYREIVFLIKIFFFVYLGISIPINETGTLYVALAIALGIYFVRPFATKLLVTRHVSAYDRTVISVMTPKGLAAAVLASLPTHFCMSEGDDIQTITYNLVLISIVLTSLLIPIIERTGIGKIMQKSIGPSKDMDFTRKKK